MNTIAKKNSKLFVPTQPFQKLIFPMVLMLFAISVQTIFAQTEAKRIERLSDLAKVWGAVKFFHPYPAYKEIDWDKALIEAIPKVNEAQSAQEYAAAINSMLGVLNDGQTRAEVVSGTSPTDGKADGAEPFRLENGVLFADALGAGRIVAQDQQKARELPKTFFKLLPQAKTLVFDMRAAGESNGFTLLLANDLMRQILSAMLDRKVTLGTIRYRMNNGYPPQEGMTSGGYYSGLMTDTPNALGDDGAKPFKMPPMVVIVDDASPGAEIFSGLQAAGKAFVVSESKDLGATLHTIKLADNIVVKMRTAEIVNPDGAVGFAPDALAPKGEALKTAQKIVTENKFVSERPKIAAVNAGQLSQKDKPYAEMEFPSKEYRLLALFRFWNVINYFFPYKDLTGTDWNQILPKYIPKLEASKDAAEYQLTVRELSAETHDSHVSVQNANVLAEKIGTFLPPLNVRFIENQTVIVKTLDDKLPVKAGDVILTMDGEDIGKRREFLARITSASTTQSLMLNVHRNLLRGQKNSIAKLTVRGADGTTRQIEIPRQLEWRDPKFRAAEGRTTPVFGVLPSGFGYADLARLTNAEVDKMFDAIKNTPAVIFDMRGYPKGTAWSIAPRLSDKQSPVAALVSRPIQDAVSLSISGRSQFAIAQTIPPRGDKEIYSGKVVMLIDEYAISQSEHTALFFEAARPDIVFVGTPTAGANGDVTTLILPGNLTASFSGHSIRHADGRQLQRVGIQPTIKVAPTVKGLTEGRDEILDAAVKFLQENKK